MKLNLGAGRVLFPADRAKPPGHLMPLPGSAYEPGWVNVDRVGLAGIGEVVDLFRFPWVRSSNGSPWADSSVDEIYAAHLVEHIPHQVRAADGLPGRIAAEYRALAERLDGWFVFFSECWRILKPGGVMYVVVPWGLSTGGVTDPSHTRLVLPGAFEYLSGPSPDAPFDYAIPARFACTAPLLRVNEHWSKQLDGATPEMLGTTAMTYFNVASEFRVVLTALKEAE